MKLFEPRGSRDVERRDRHFPGQVPVDAYGNGGFRFAEMSHRGSILCLPSGVHGWEVETPEAMSVEAFSPALGEAGAFELLLVGTGRDLVPLPRDVAEALRARGARFEAMSTGAAIRIYNIMLGERRKVAAALIAVD